jgi:hypothetical protein
VGFYLCPVSSLGTSGLGTRELGRLSSWQSHSSFFCSYVGPPRLLQVRGRQVGDSLKVGEVLLLFPLRGLEETSDSKRKTYLI